MIKAHPLYEPILVLVLLGAFTKSAQFPFHFWLPHAMAAPTPVSAYLHSATMVKAGIFLLARLFPALAGTETWFYIVSGVGLATQLFAAYVALFRHDLKGLLAYSTVSHLGLITLLFGLGTPLGAVAAVFHIINHAIFKASLFMAAGIIDHETGTRDMRRLSGLARYMPWTAALATIAAGAMAGVPLLNGFLSKEMFFAETLQVQWLGALVLDAAGRGDAGRHLHRGLLDALRPRRVLRRRRRRDCRSVPHEPPRWMKVPVEVLVGLCLLVGLLPRSPSIRCCARRRRRAAGAAAGVLPGAVARVQPAAADERRRARRRGARLLRAPLPLRPARLPAATRLDGRAIERERWWRAPCAARGGWSSGSPTARCSATCCCSLLAALALGFVGRARACRSTAIGRPDAARRARRRS